MRYTDNLTPFSSSVHPARSGSIWWPRYTFLKKSRILLNYWTPCQCIQIRIGMNQATTSPHTKKKRNHLGVHTFYLTSSHLLHHALKNQHPIRHICQYSGSSLKVTSDGVLPVRCQVDHQHGMAAKKKGGGGGVTLRLEPIWCIACFSFIGFWYWFWLVEFASLNFKGSIWAFQNGATWSWSNLSLYLLIFFCPFHCAMWTCELGTRLTAQLLFVLFFLGNIHPNRLDTVGTLPRLGRPICCTETFLSMLMVEIYKVKLLANW